MFNETPIVIDANLRFSEIEIFRMFNIDMAAIGAMDSHAVRGNNKFLLRFTRHNNAVKSDPASVSAKFDRKGNMTSATPERAAALHAHAVRVQSNE